MPFITSRTATSRFDRHASRADQRFHHIPLGDGRVTGWRQALALPYRAPVLGRPHGLAKRSAVDDHRRFEPGKPSPTNSELRASGRTLERTSRSTSMVGPFWVVEADGRTVIIALAGSLN